jgi:hypothetical protein
LAGSFARFGGREMSARRNTFQTVECSKPVAPATSRGPQPVRRRHSQITSSSSGASCWGERCGRLERPNKHDSVRRASSLASSQLAPGLQGKICDCRRETAALRPRF